MVMKVSEFETEAPLLSVILISKGHNPFVFNFIKGIFLLLCFCTPLPWPSVYKTAVLVERNNNNSKVYTYEAFNIRGVG